MVRALLTLAVVATLVPVGGPRAAELTFEQALSRKPVVSVVFDTEGRFDQLVADLDLTPEQADALAQLAWEERVWETDLRARQPGREDWNAEVAGVTRRADLRLRALLGPGFPQFAATMDGWFHEDSGRSGLVWTEACLTYEVYATQYDANTAYEVAIPDQYVKFANLGWGNEPGYAGSDYEVRLQRNNYDIVVWVGDVGPWNIDDNYWNDLNPPRPRRMWTDLPQGKPESEAAYYDGYNGGLDQYDRTVTNPTALDMSFDVASDVGLAYLANDWIIVTWQWECFEIDGDGDGYMESEGDCSDGDPAVHPGATEQPNHIDDDCDGMVDEDTDYYDDDGDGFTEADGDCDDSHPSTYPGAPEQPNGIDDDCDGQVDEGQGDDDDAGDDDAGDDDVGDDDVGGADLDGDGWSVGEGDCDDLDPAVNPGAEERRNGIDDDCDGVVDHASDRGGDGGGGCACEMGTTGAPVGALAAAVLGGLAVRRRRVGNREIRR